ncbi:hypothetical protein [Aquirhabdus sp.]|uniref:hypothetical protein n=1 Tax=Aquirhabdus sp. TaxID=2824160 RepID=UPI00396C629C
MSWFSDSFLCVLLGCTHTLEFTLPTSETLQVVVRESDSILERCQILPDSPAQRDLIEWLAENKNGWKKTPVSYASSSDVSISGKTFSINFIDQTVVIFYNLQQFDHAVDPKQYQSLICSNYK